MTQARARFIAIQAIQANIATYKRLAANARTRRDFSRYKKAQQYWEDELEKLTSQQEKLTPESN